MRDTDVSKLIVAPTVKRVTTQGSDDVRWERDVYVKTGDTTDPYWTFATVHGPTQELASIRAELIVHAVNKLTPPQEYGTRGTPIDTAAAE